MVRILVARTGRLTIFVMFSETYGLTVISYFFDLDQVLVEI
jgi:hypothetical protein